MGDFIIGSPGYDVTQNSSRANAGGAQIVQGGLITRAHPGRHQVTTQIGVGHPFGPFSINATTPANLPIYVFGSTATTPELHAGHRHQPRDRHRQRRPLPQRDLAARPANTGHYFNGIPDAIITINPRSALKLPNGVNTITITGQITVDLTAVPIYTWTGTAP